MVELDTRSGGNASIAADALGPASLRAGDMSEFAAFWLENRTMLLRWIYQLKRQPVSIFTSVIQPVLWLVLFGNLLSKMTSQSNLPGGDYLTFMTAGAMVMTVFNAAMNGGVELLFDRETGFIDRLMAAPINRLSIVTSRFGYVIGLSAAQSALIAITAVIFGVHFATGLAGVIVSLLVGALFGAGIATLSIVLAFLVRHHPDFFTVTAFLSLPVLFASSALAPLDQMPGWLRVAAELNPMTYATEATRKLVVSGWDVGAVTRMVVAIVLFDAIALLIAARVLRRGLE